MPVITPDRAGSAAVCAFLDLIAFSEGTSRDSGSEDGLASRNDGYDVIVRGEGAPEIFTSYANHPFAPSRPAKLIQPPSIKHPDGIYSTASGRYQILCHEWEAYRRILSLPDFGPFSQDRIALQMLHECQAVDPIENAHIQEAITRCSSRWASFPGNDYGQGGVSMDRLVRQWEMVSV